MKLEKQKNQTSFYSLMREKTVIDRAEIPYKDRGAVYDRALRVFNILYEDTSINDDLIEDPNGFWDRYCFVPTKKQTSFIDYMVQKGVVDSEYSVLKQTCYEYYIQMWLDHMDYCLYEKVTTTEIRDFESLIEAENELCNMKEELFGGIIIRSVLYLSTDFF